jgi:hypothetical protein
MGGTWSYFLPSIVAYPFGIPASLFNFKDGKISWEKGRSTLKKAFTKTKGYDPHNFILTAALHYGVITAVSLLLFYCLMFKQFFLAIIKNKNDLYASYLIILSAINIAYICHCWFHNASIVLGEMRVWVWVGLNMGLIRLVEKKWIVKKE